MSNRFKIVILNGRPAAGKSEVIDYLKSTPVEERLKRFHIGNFVEFDDFVYVWEKFEEDDILTKNGKERVWTTKNYYFKDEFLWHVFIEKLNLAVAKRLAAEPKFFENNTAILEFARGGKNGFEEAYSHLSPEILKQAGIVYIRVSYEESVRKNRRRARPGMADSILHHSLPDEKMEYYYKINDWDQLTARNDNAIAIKGIDVPYAVVQNEPEVTDSKEKLGPALEKTFATLWARTKH